MHHLRLDRVDVMVVADALQDELDVRDELLYLGVAVGSGAEAETSASGVISYHWRKVRLA